MGVVGIAESGPGNESFGSASRMISMTCSTCGAPVPAGRSRCATCGAPVAQRQEAPGLVVTHACPRCRYAGSGESYFARGTNVAKLVGITVLTSGFGAPVYYLLRHSHQVCPRCGMSWGEEGRRSLARAPTPEAREMESLPGGRSERSLRRGTVVLYTLAALLAGSGTVQGEPGRVAAGVGAGAGGYVMQRNLRQARERRRQMLLDSLVPPVLRLAAQHGGLLTVSDVAAGLGWTLPRATKVLQYLDDGIRVDSRVTDEGMIVFEFRELLGRRAADVRGELLA